jgi:maleamate amidohydrolase
MPDQRLVENYQGVFGTRLGFGDRPALLIVDFINAYVTEGEPLYAPQVIDAVRETVAVVGAARGSQVPVIFTRVIYSPSGADGGIFLRKVPALRAMVEGEPMSEIVPELTPAPDDVVIKKQDASAFFGTALAATLTSQGIDTLILAGCSTSGCIRASAVDGMQHGFRVVVPRECVADRHHGPHEANLFDIDSKYGDVVSKEEVLVYLAGLS